MKKIFYTIALFLLLIPLKVGATSTYIDNYYIDITVNDNGNLLVKELFTYKGKFNGAYKTISYNSNSATVALPVDSSLYSPDDVILKEIKDIKVDSNVDFSYINHEGSAFERNDYASVGSNGYYSVTSGYKEYTYKIFNPGTYKGFYIEYELENAVINHSDVAEVWLNIFNNIPDNINHLELHVNIENNNELLRAWAHGPLTGNIKIVNNKQVIFTVDDLTTSDTFDIRLAFDKLGNAKKSSDVVALDKIIEYETNLADIANQEREDARKYLEEYEKKQKFRARIFNVCGCFWILGLLCLIRFIYKNYDKEYLSEFKGKYFRDIPNDNDPALVGYLVNKKIRTEDLSATILNLINMKKIEFAKVDKKDYKFTLVDETNLTDTEKLAVNLLFDGGKSELLSSFKKRAKASYTSFLKDYSDWYKSSLNEAKAKNYFEIKIAAKLLSVLYSLIGLFLLILANEYTNKILVIAIFLLALISLIYFATYTKRTKEGNEEYLKWIGLKNFMNDFGKMDVKELPEVRLWEKYLVYAVSLGCASKLAKTMKIKIKEMNTDINTLDTSYMDDFYFMSSMNSVITSSINSAISSARSVAASENSSGSGFGGGFSGGGGGFSGGGGGSTGHF